MLRAAVLVVLALGAVMAGTPNPPPYMNGATSQDVPLDAQISGSYLSRRKNVGLICRLQQYAYLQFVRLQGRVHVNFYQVALLCEFLFYVCVLV